MTSGDTPTSLEKYKKTGDYDQELGSGENVKPQKPTFHPP